MLVRMTPCRQLRHIWKSNQRCKFKFKSTNLQQIMLDQRKLPLPNMNYKFDLLIHCDKNTGRLQQFIWTGHILHIINCKCSSKFRQTPKKPIHLVQPTLQRRVKDIHNGRCYTRPSWGGPPLMHIALGRAIVRACRRTNYFLCWYNQYVQYS